MRSRFPPALLQRTTLALLGGLALSCGLLSEEDQESHAPSKSPESAPSALTVDLPTAELPTPELPTPAPPTPPPLNIEKWRSIAFTQDDDLHLLTLSEPASPVITLLSDFEIDGETRARWSPSGERLAWAKVIDGAQVLSLWFDDEVQEEVFAPTEEPPDEVYFPSWVGDEEIIYPVGPSEKPTYYRSVLGSGEPGALPAVQLASGPKGDYSGASGYILASLEGDSSLYRPGMEAVPLPQDAAFTLSPDGQRVLLNSNEIVSEEGDLPDGVLSTLHFTVDETQLPPCTNPHTCPISTGSVDVGSLKWSDDAKRVGITAQFPEISSPSGNTPARTIAYLSQGSELRVGKAAGFAVFNRWEPTWGFLPEGEVFLAQRLNNEEDEPRTWVFRIASQDGPFFAGPSYEGLGSSLEVKVASDHRSFFVHTYEPDIGYQVIALARNTEGDAITATTLISNFDSGQDGNILFPQPQGSSVLVSLGDCENKGSQSCRDSWSEVSKEGAHSGFQIWSREGDVYKQGLRGDGMARWAPDGEGLFVLNKGWLTFIALSHPERIYPLVQLDSFQVLIPDKWPE